MANEVQLFKAAGLSLANIGKYKAALARVQASAPAIGGVPILRLDKEGVWRYGQQLTEVEPGSLWAANPLTFEKGWVAWKKGINKPQGKQMKNILSGELVNPADLPDLGDAKWTESVSVQFQCINGQDEGTTVEYTSNSSGGVERWHELVAQLSHQFEVDPTKLVAVVSLEHDGYFHTDQSYGTRHPETKKPGWIVKPVFAVTDWMAMDGAGSEQPAEEQDEQDEGDQQEEQQPDPTPPSGRRQSTINAGANGTAPPTSTRRQSTIKPTGAQLDAEATKLTGIAPDAGRAPATDAGNGVVRRRRRAT